MKKLGKSSGGAVWNEKLVSQLAFIRKHKRFPVNRRTLAPLLAISTASLALPIWVSITMVRTPSDGSTMPYWLLLLIWLPVVVGIFRYFQSLRFVVVPAYPFMADNMALVKRFLVENHFAHGRHPEAPEVFQMLSQDLGKRKELREVLLFIADDGRILLNSHFAGNTFGMPVSSGHSRSMARMLKRFLEETQASASTADLTRSF